MCLLHLHVRIQEFSPSGGGGGGGGGARTALFCYFCCFFSPHLQLIEQFYRRDRSQGPMVYFLENNNFPRFQRGSNILRGGGEGSNFFPRGGGGGGVQMLNSVETYRNCDFPRTPYPLSVSAHALPSLVARTQ